MLYCRHITGSRWRAVLLLVLQLLVPGTSAWHAATTEAPRSRAIVHASDVAPVATGHAEHTCGLCRVANDPQEPVGHIALLVDDTDVHTQRRIAPVTIAAVSSRTPPNRAPRAPPAHS